MEEQFICDICNAPMKLEVRLTNVHKRGSVYRRRRFKCTFCDYVKVIYAGGSGDEKTWPQTGVDEINKIFKQEEENRDESKRNSV
jgi:hypothetical protein